MENSELIKLKEELKRKPWFAASDPAIQAKILGLDKESKGFIAHLVNRQTEGGGTRTLRLQDLLIPEGKLYGIFVNFLVEKISDPTVKYCYQYFVWKQGEESGAKGIILVQKEGKISHVICLRGFSFAIGGGEAWDCIGGFSEADEAGGSGMLGRFKTETLEELGLESLPLQEVITLGKVYPDRGMTPNAPQLFAAIIDGSDMQIVRQAGGNTDSYEMESGAVIVPVEDLWGPKGFLFLNEDALFLSCITRLMALGVIKQGAI